MREKEQQFYCKLFRMINADMELKGINPNQFSKEGYFISRQTYYNIRNICQGTEKKRRLTFDLLNSIYNNLGYEVYDIDYSVRKIKK